MSIKNLDKRREYNRNWYRLHREERRAVIRNRRKERIEWLQSVKSERGCSKCGETHYACLDFHHIRGNHKRKDTISVGIRHGWNKERVLIEIESCVILCANCHRKEHSNRGVV